MEKIIKSQPFTTIQRERDAQCGTADTAISLQQFSSKRVKFFNRCHRFNIFEYRKAYRNGKTKQKNPQKYLF